MKGYNVYLNCKVLVYVKSENEKEAKEIAEKEVFRNGEIVEIDSIDHAVEDSDEC